MFRWIRPGDLAWILLLSLATTWAALSGRPGGLHAAAFHGVLLVGLVVVVLATGRTSWGGVIAFVTINVITTVLYTSLGKLGLLLHDGTLDQVLAALDVAIFGVDPSLVAQSWVTPLRTELLSVVYILFLLYLQLTILMSAMSLEGFEREELLCGMSVNWALAFLGYLALPAHGPIWLHQETYTVVITGGAAFDAMMDGFQRSGGALGAFPSLHVGGAFFLCAFDLRRRSFRAMTYAPIVALIAVSTIYLRFHYVADWLGGIAVACFALWVAPRAVRVWARQRGVVVPEPARAPWADDPWLARIVRGLARASVGVFFREVTVRGAEGLPARFTLVGPDGAGRLDRWLVLAALGARGATLVSVSEAPSGVLVPVGFWTPSARHFRTRALVSFGTPVGTMAAARSQLAALGAPPGEDDALLGWASSLLVARRVGPALPGAFAGTLADEHELRFAILAARQRLERDRPRELAALTGRVARFRERLDTLGIEPAELGMQYRVVSNLHFALRELELVLLGSWLAAWGAMTHLAAYHAIGPLAERGVRTDGEIADRKIAYSLVIFPLSYLLWAGVVGWLAGAVAGTVCLLTLPAFGYYTLVFRERIPAVWRRLRTFLRRAFAPREFEALRAEAGAIEAEMLALASPTPEEPL